MSPLGELTVRWTGAEDGEVEITDEFDGAPPEEPTDRTEPPADQTGEQAADPPAEDNERHSSD
jgi:segregation and condensation protein A